MPTLAELRTEYMEHEFGPRQAAAQPVEQFGAWFEQARAAGLAQPRAMTLATVNALGRPTARVVVLAGFSADGFDLATDARSPKGADLRQRPWAALVFAWTELERQVRLEGAAELLDEAWADRYFQRRARASQLATVLAPQSAVLADRDGLEESLLQRLAQPAFQPVPRPPDYRAYRVRPALVEFWQGRADSLHDRVRYRQTAEGTWVIERLAP